MAEHLILKLEGPLQAWGVHTFEDYRAGHLFPTLSGILGLLAGCLGITRQDDVGLQRLVSGLDVAVRADRIERANGTPIHPERIEDFHTVLDARRVDGKASATPVVSHRQYLCDARFTVALRTKPAGDLTLNELEAAVRQPIFTPYLGRRSCPLARPLFETRLEAFSFLEAFATVPPHEGVIYGVEPEHGEYRVHIRDVPLPSGHRQFGSRDLSVVHVGRANHVSQ